MGDLPCDNQIRTLLDPVGPSPAVSGVCRGVCRPGRGGQLSSWRGFADQLLIALDGTEYLRPRRFIVARCSQRTHANGQVTYVHQAITLSCRPWPPRGHLLGARVHPPQDGHAKQDCEQVAAKRWIERQAGRYQQVTILGDDLYCKQPFCELLLDHGFNFILVCKLSRTKPCMNGLPH